MSVKPGAAAEVALGLGIAALGAFILAETRLIKVAPIYAKVGPAVIPTIVGIILLALGVVFVWQSFRAKPAVGIDAPGSQWDTPTDDHPRADWTALIAITIGLIAQIILLDPSDAPFGIDSLFEKLGASVTVITGFVPSATILFVCVAIAFGSRRYLRDIIIAILLAVAAYVGFVHGLGLPLPKGLIGEWL